MRNVREALIAFAAEAGVDPEQYEEYLGVYLAAHIAPEVPERYRRLVQEILWRLPEGWDERAEWSVDVSPEETPRGYASVRREEEGEGDTSDSIQLWVVTLYPALLDRLSDAACRWAIAHEFGHVASGLPTGSIVIDGKPHTRVKGTPDFYEEAPDKAMQEAAANQLAVKWGFSEEFAAFLRED
jgi:hypothetical protein